MQFKVSKVMIILFILCILSGVIYFVVQNSSHEEEPNTQITYETINMLSNLRLGISEFDSIHPYQTKNREVIYINHLIFESLLSITPDYQITNSLAKECSKVGEKSYVVKLKENTLWSDKQKLTAQDVKFSIDELQKSEGSIYYENIKYIQKVDAVDELTVRIELKQAVPFFEYNLIFPIISQKQYEKEDVQASKQIPLGTGMYKIANITESKIELTQNENYREYENEKANIRTVEINLYKTVGEVYNAFKLGNIDFLHTSNTNIEEHIGSIGYGKKVYGNREYDYLALNCKNTILQYQEVRKAIELSINQENLVASSLENTVNTAYFPIEEKNYLIKETKVTYETNIEKAKKMLQDAGWKYEYGIWQKQIDEITKTINITLTVSKSDEKRVKVANEIQKQLEGIGIKIRIEEISDEAYQKCLENHQYEMLFTGVYTSLSPDLTSFLGEGNLANYSNQEITNILAELSNITEDELKKEKYQRILEIYSEDVPYIGLYRNQDFILYASNFRGDITPNHYSIYYNLVDWYRQE